MIHMPLKWHHIDKCNKNCKTSWHFDINFGSFELIRTHNHIIYEFLILFSFFGKISPIKKMLVWIRGGVWTSLEFQICACFMQCLSWNLSNTSPRHAQISLLPLQIWCLLVWVVVNFGLSTPYHNLAHIQYCSF
jgi:hypothetical protein